MKGIWRVLLVTLPMLLNASSPVLAQPPGRVYVGGLFGVSTLSADARSETSGTDAAISLYKPENGVAVNAFVGIHLAQYFTLQANYMWNRNELTLLSSSLAPDAGAYYEQHRDSDQHAVVADGLIYFRRLESAVRPYLGTGLSVLRFTSRTTATTTTGDLPVPPLRIASTRIALRSAVGIDIAVSAHLAFRYSFSETIGGNPISPFLTPQGQRGLANFQNLFGLVGRF
jgi:hypothetical protein